MNKVILCGRLTRDPDVRYSNGEKPMCIARYTLAVNRRFQKEGEQNADFINCVAFGKQGEFAERHLKRGTKIVVCGRIQTGSYTNRDGVKVYTTDVIVEEYDFAESRSSYDRNSTEKPNIREETAENQPPLDDGFMSIPEGIEDELPFI